LKIAVCIKQVPDSADIKWTEKNTLQREGMESVINPFDEFALETALIIKDNIPDTEITAVSMGPNQAEDMLKRAIAHGIDKAVLLSDKKFAGSDTYATAKTLACGIKHAVPDFDLIICGQYATDGDTGQTGPALATFLDVPQITYVKNILFENGNLYFEKETECSVEKLKFNTAGVVCVVQSDSYLRPALIDGFRKASKTEVVKLSAQDIGINPEETGFKGSPTYVSKAFRPEVKKTCEFVERPNPEEYVQFLNDKVNELKERFMINE